MDIHRAKKIRKKPYKKFAKNCVGNKGTTGN